MEDADALGSDSDDAHLDALVEASKLLTAVVARSLATSDTPVSTPQLRVLVMLHGHRDLNLTAIARGLGVNASSASRTCEQLVAAGLVSRQEDRQDRRNLQLRLTRRGSGMVDDLMDRRRAIFSRIVEGMPVDARDDLTAGLEALIASARHLSDGGRLGDQDGDETLIRWLL